ncbi:hypothetical protein DPMN_054162 [Dreissena polymorpha]|uniref:Uncharacterized protein n=1 Tax=Dreissena polymorpha TaxID=45954 RepID=A0A9D4CQ67_DREPO|nr:hypothetical protein DPMN_054162 [Dreissena polymorpha]
MILKIKVVLDLNLSEHPERIWNADETGFKFQHTPVRIVAEKGQKRVISKTSNLSTMY